MDLKITQIDDLQIAEVVSDQLVITNAEDGLDLLGNLFFQGLDKVIIYETNITPAFFQLRSGMAGEILQKFSNYRVKLAIVGDFADHPSKSLQEFMGESNKFGHVNFVTSRVEALEKLKV